VCDSKFFIRQMLEEKQNMIEMQNTQLVGDMGLKVQIEKKKQQIRKVNKEFKKVKDMYRVDFQKVKIMLNRFKTKVEDLQTEESRRQKENDELVDKRKQVQSTMDEVNNEIGELQLTSVELPDKIEVADKHLVRMNQEKRRLDAEYRELLRVLQETRQGN